MMHHSLSMGRNLLEQSQHPRNTRHYFSSTTIHGHAYWCQSTCLFGNKFIARIGVRALIYLTRVYRCQSTRVRIAYQCRSTGFVSVSEHLFASKLPYFHTTLHEPDHYGLLSDNMSGFRTIKASEAITEMSLPYR